MPERAYVVIVEGADPVRLRQVIEREGWQMPLAPLVADGDVKGVVRIWARKRGGPLSNR